VAWALKWGDKASKLLAAAAEAGMPPPESAIPPELPDHLEQYVKDFWQLTTCRNFHQGGSGPIIWTAIDAYAERHGYTDDVDKYEEFMACMTAMDTAYMKHFSESADKAREGAAKGKKPGPAPKKSQW
jgi:hypothetical protein